MAYRFTLLWARLLLAIGLLFVGLGVALAAVALFIDTTWTGMTLLAGVAERILVAVFLILSGILAGGPFIVFGQIIVVLVDQVTVLRRMRRDLRRLESRLAGGTPSSRPANRIAEPH